MLILAAPLTAMGQGAPPTPGAVEETLRQPPPRPLSDEPPLVDESPPPRREAVPPGGPKIPIERFVFEGNTVYSDDELRAVVADREGTGLTLEEIYAVADRLTSFYLDNGYSVALVTVPAQRVADGIVRLEVTEGRVDRIHLEGNERYGDEFLYDRTHLVASGTILRFDHMERSLLLLNDMPGLLARAVLVSGDEYGTSDIRLRLVETPWDGRLAFDNHGPESVGEWRLNADLGLNNRTGFGDRIDLGATISESNLLRQGRIGWSFPVGRDGGRLALNYCRADYDVGGDFAALGIDGHSESARIRYSYPRIRSRSRNLYWNAGAAYNRGRSVMEDVPDPLTDGRVGVIEAGLRYDARGERGHYSLDAQVASNLRANGTEDDGVTRDGGVLLRVNLGGSGERFFDGGWSLFGRGEMQISADPLPDSSQFGIGGPYSVRGFVSSRQRGDQGLSGSAELRRYHRLDQTFLILRGFVDAGWVHRKRPLTGQDRDDGLVAAGIGASAVFKERVSLDVTWATPMDGRERGDDSSRFWATLGLTF